MSGTRRRQQLLDVTRTLVVQDGFHAVSMEAVARAAGITRPVVYGHFPDLPSLLEALVSREAARALEQLATILPVDLTSGEPRELLLAGLRDYLRAAEAEPDRWRLVLMPPEGAPALLREHIAQGREALVASLAALVRPGLLAGREPPDSELTARALSALSDEAVRLLLTDPVRFPVARLVAQADWFLAALIEGVGRAPRR